LPEVFFYVLINGSYAEKINMICFRYFFEITAFLLKLTDVFEVQDLGIMN